MQVGKTSTNVTLLHAQNRLKKLRSKAEEERAERVPLAFELCGKGRESGALISGTTQKFGIVARINSERTAPFERVSLQERECASSVSESVAHHLSS